MSLCSRISNSLAVAGVSNDRAEAVNAGRRRENLSARTGVQIFKPEVR
jgi:hypothetical protein